LISRTVLKSLSNVKFPAEIPLAGGTLLLLANALLHELVEPAAAATAVLSKTASRLLGLLEAVAPWAVHEHGEARASGECARVCRPRVEACRLLVHRGRSERLVSECRGGRGLDQRPGFEEQRELLGCVLHISGVYILRDK
jgi:hypothetical protein